MILYFHSLVTEKSKKSSDDMLVSDFIFLINHLKASGYVFVSVSEYFLTSISDRKRYVCVTFDDADYSIYFFRRALRSLGIPITIFASPAMLKSGYAIDEKKLSENNRLFRIIYKNSGLFIRFFLNNFISSNFSVRVISTAEMKVVQRELSGFLELGTHGNYHIKHSWINSVSVFFEVYSCYKFIQRNPEYLKIYAYPYGCNTMFARFLLRILNFKFAFATEGESEKHFSISRINGSELLKTIKG